MNTSKRVAALSQWISDSYPPEVRENFELHLRRRIDKLMEEVGEVGRALNGVVGENPRKGVTHTMHDVLDELLDVAITALGAWEAASGFQGAVIGQLHSKLGRVLDRAGIPDREEDPRGNPS